MLPLLEVRSESVEARCAATGLPGFGVEIRCGIVGAWPDIAVAADGFVAAERCDHLVPSLDEEAPNQVVAAFWCVLHDFGAVIELIWCEDLVPNLLDLVPNEVEEVPKDIIETFYEVVAPFCFDNLVKSPGKEVLNVLFEGFCGVKEVKKPVIALK